MRWIALLALFTISTAQAFAGGKEVVVSVKGMVCGFCAQGVEKKFSSDPAVEKVKVSLGEKRVKLTLKEGQSISDETITRILTESGYNVDRIGRD